MSSVAPPRSGTSPIRILHLEDDDSDTLLVRSVLETEGIECQFLHARTREAFLAYLDGGEFDLIFADNSLKSFDGVAALAIAREKRPDVPYLFVSGTIDEELAIETLKQGATDYVFKQRLNRLAPAVRRALAEAQDRRKKRETETALLRQARLLDLASDAIVIGDLSGRVSYWNQGAERLYGWTRSEALGKVFDELLDTQYPSPPERVRERLFEAGRWEGELVQSRRDGERLTVLSRWTLERESEGRPATALIINTDLTPRTRLEEQLRQSQKMEATGTLAGGVAHEFNNMLTSIIGFSHLLLQELESDSPLLEFVGEIRKAADRAAAMTRQLLTFSRRQVLNPVVLDLNSVVQNLSGMFRRLIGEDVAFEIVLGKKLGCVKVDPSQIEQAIVNLVINARDAMPRGGRLTIATSNTEIPAEPGQPPPAAGGSSVVLAVSDTGTGMDAETRSRIFEPFFTTKPIGKGTGLGLSTVYGLVQQSGGQISVSSEPGRGTTFRISLPRTEEQASEAEALSTETDACRGSEVVLLVDDEEAVRSLARRILKAKGYKVLEAGSGEDALERSRKHSGRIDLLLTDVVMPGRSGPEIAQVLSRERPDLKVLYVSGYTDDDTFTRGLLETGVSFLQKPFGLEILARRVRDILDETEKDLARHGTR
jgi:two-component system, cell cycle sensor histidine kinase and response regulator CckA